MECIYFTRWKEISREGRLRNSHLVLKTPYTFEGMKKPFSAHTADLAIPPGEDERRRKKDLLNTVLLIAVPRGSSCSPQIWRRESNL